MILNNDISIAFKIFGFEVAWYPICILTGILIAVFLASREAPRLGIDKDLIIDGVVFGVPLSIVGARLFYVIFEFEQYGFDILKIIGYEDGSLQIRGLSITGGVITAFIFVYFYARKKQIDFLKLFDIVFPLFLVAQFFGRWGNFFNKEAYGGVVQSQFVIDIIPKFIMKHMIFEGDYHHPTFLYEGLWNLTGFIIYLFLRRKHIFKKGDLGLLYFAWYFTCRGLFIEPFRTDPLVIIGTQSPDAAFFNRINVVLSLIFAITAIILFIVKRYKFNTDYYHDIVLENSKEEKIPFI